MYLRKAFEPSPPYYQVDHHLVSRASQFLHTHTSTSKMGTFRLTYMSNPQTSTSFSIWRLSTLSIAKLPSHTAKCFGYDRSVLKKKTSLQREACFKIKPGRLCSYTLGGHVPSHSFSFLDDHQITSTIPSHLKTTTGDLSITNVHAFQCPKCLRNLLVRAILTST